MLTGRRDNDGLGVLFGLTECKPKLEKTKQNIYIKRTVEEQSTHKWLQHLSTTHHLSREAFPIEPSLISLGAASLRRWGEMKGHEVSIRLRGHSDEQAQTAGALLCSASTWNNGKKKVMACTNMQTFLKLRPFVWASSVDAFDSQTFKHLRHKCWNP